MSNLKNRLNGYARAVPERVFDSCPKAVWAAIAVSFATCGGDHLDEAEQRIVNEWWTLYDAGIVPQKPKFPDTRDWMERG